MTSRQQPKNNPGKVIVERVHIEDIEEDIGPPPPHLNSNFKTLQDWLLSVCEQDKPHKPISQYKFRLFESPDDCTLVLVGENTYHEEKNRSITCIEFEPENRYFKLPKSYFENLNREQGLEKLTSQLTDFTNTEKFKNSFLSKANTMIFEANGQIIWSKQ
ncbi:MAG: hypothetical protein JWN76_1043 [Chitinophagaceae bacterium]|nr:hypothetical protein [Chitinophagaceae bacterium]